MSEEREGKSRMYAAEMNGAGTGHGGCVMSGTGNDAACSALYEPVTEFQLARTRRPA